VILKEKIQYFLTKELSKLGRLIPCIISLNFNRFMNSNKTELCAQPTCESKVITETEIIQLADGRPKNLTLDQIKAILNIEQVNLKIILAEPAKWIDWESAMTLMMKDTYVVALSDDPKWPLAVSFDFQAVKGDTMNYDKEMKFIVKI
jgi:hypothetical protein